MLSGRSGDDQEQGFTLVELLVVLILLGTISAMVSVTLIKTIRSSRQSQARTTAAASLRVTLDRISRDIRAADPLQMATPTVIAMDVYRTTDGCVRMTYALNVSTQTVTQTKATCAAPTSVTSTSTIAQLESTSSLFTYYGPSSDTALTGTITPANVARVVLNATIQPPEARGAVTVTTTSELRNH